MLSVLTNLLLKLLFISPAVCLEASGLVEGIFKFFFIRLSTLKMGRKDISDTVSNGFSQSCVRRVHAGVIRHLFLMQSV